MNDLHFEEETVDMALLAGHILLDNGAEIFRVEETIKRICEHYGVSSENAFVLSNGIFVTAGSRTENTYAKVQHIPVHTTNLSKIADVNQLSREIEAGKYSIEEARIKLEAIQAAPNQSPSYQIFASGLGSGAFCYLFGGTFIDAVCAFIAGFLLYIFMVYVGSAHLSKIVRNILGAVIVTAICSIFAFSGLGQNLNHMITGSIMPMIPGVSFTNAIRDIADGDYISGAVRMLDAILVFVCIAVGVGLCITFFSFLTGGALL